MESAERKTQRLEQLKQLLLAHPHGITRAELARRLEVNRSTAGRYIEEVSRPPLNWPIYEDGNLLFFNTEDVRFDVSFTLYETTAIFEATRLMGTWLDKHNPHAASAIRQLGRALEKFSQPLSQHIIATARLMDDQSQRSDPNYLRTFEVLTRAWAQTQWVHLWYRRDPNSPIREYDLAPYFIEPYALGRTTHVIGQCRTPNRQMTFKLERIERIEFLEETYTVPADFDPTALLAQAWGIWTSDQPPQQVSLKFSAAVANRVRETQWQRGETTEIQDDGSLIWHAQIAEPREMLPWIRGWGADVEVLRPDWLRDMLIGEAKRMAELYSWYVTSTPNNQSTVLNDFFGE